MNCQLASSTPAGISIMNRLFPRLACFTVVVLAAPAAFAECVYPARVEIPDGLTADKATMLVTQNAVKEYVANMQAYLDCIVMEEKEARSKMDDLDAEVEQQREDLLNKKYNAGIDEMEVLAARFNEELRRYRERNE